ncbi:MAG: hypothetical protein ACPGLV_08380 [Bacteroidia bacterium]
MLNKLAFILFIPLSLFAQKSKDSVSTASPKLGMIVLNSQTRYSSNFLSTTEFLNLATSPIINDNFLNEFYDNAMLSNSLVYFNQNSIEAPVPKTNQKLSVRLSNHSFLNTTLDKDLVGLLAKGNSFYKGKFANVNHSDFLYFTQSGISLSYTKPITTKKLFIFIKPNIQLNQTSTFYHFSIQNSSLFTEENGEYLDLVYNYEYAIQQSPKAFSGIGINGSLTIDLITANAKTVASIGIYNVGSMRFNNSNHFYGANNSELSYSGSFLNYNDLSSLGGTNVQTEADSLIKLIEPQKIENSSKMAQPFNLNFYIKTNVSPKDLVGFNIYYLPGYTLEPVFNLSYDRQIGKSQFGFNLGNGAFGGLSAGLNYNYTTDKFFITSQILGLTQLNNSLHAQSGLSLTVGYIL